MINRMATFATVLSLGVASTASADVTWASTEWIVNECLPAMAEARTPNTSALHQMSEDDANQFASQMSAFANLQPFDLFLASEHEVVAITPGNLGDTGAGCQSYTFRVSSEETEAEWATLVSEALLRSGEIRTESHNGIETMSVRGAGHATEVTYAAIVLSHLTVQDASPFAQILVIHIPNSPYACGFFPEDCS